MMKVIKLLEGRQKFRGLCRRDIAVRTAAGQELAQRGAPSTQLIWLSLKHIKLSSSPMESPKLRVGQPITPEQFDELTDEQLARLVPKAYREFFPGKDFCADGYFYLHDGTAWSFYRGDFLDE